MAKATQRSRPNDTTPARTAQSSTPGCRDTVRHRALGVRTLQNGAVASTGQTWTTGFSQRTNCGRRQVHRRMNQKQ